jgi:hypothetical protein
MDQRYVPLDIQSRAGGSLTVTAPANANLAPPGWYMLFIKNSNAVPSVAKWVQINGKPTSPLEPGPGIVPTAGPSPAAGPALGGTAATVGTGGTSSLPSSTRTSSARLVSVTIRHRVHLSDARHRGLVLSVRVTAWTDSHGRVVRVRLFRLRGSRRQLITKVYRSLRYPESFRMGLRSAALRRALRPGRYQIEIASGTSWSTLQMPERHTFTIVR